MNLIDSIKTILMTLALLSLFDAIQLRAQPYDDSIEARNGRVLLSKAVKSIALECQVLREMKSSRSVQSYDSSSRRFRWVLNKPRIDWDSTLHAVSIHLPCYVANEGVLSPIEKFGEILGISRRMKTEQLVVIGPGEKSVDASISEIETVQILLTTPSTKQITVDSIKRGLDVQVNVQNFMSGKKNEHKKLVLSIVSDRSSTNVLPEDIAIELVVDLIPSALNGIDQSCNFSADKPEWSSKIQYCVCALLHSIRVVNNITHEEVCYLYVN